MAMGIHIMTQGAQTFFTHKRTEVEFRVDTQQRSKRQLPNGGVV